VIFCYLYILNDSVDEDGKYWRIFANYGGEEKIQDLTLHKNSVVSKYATMILDQFFTTWNNIID